MPASTVTEYLAALPADRRDALNEVRRGINREEGVGAKYCIYNIEEPDHEPKLDWISRTGVDTWL